MHFIRVEDAVLLAPSPPCNFQRSKHMQDDEEEEEEEDSCSSTYACIHDCIWPWDDLYILRAFVCIWMVALGRCSSTYAAFSYFHGENGSAI